MVRAALFDTTGIEEIVGSDVKRVGKVGDHPAATFSGKSGGCGVALGVGASARVDIVVEGRTGRGCRRLAEAVASVVAAKLP